MDLKETRTQVSLNHNLKDAGSFGYWVAVSLSIITLLTFGLALIAIPNSGSNCPSNCVEYPFLEITEFYPEDYLWMYLAIILMIIYLTFVTILHIYTVPEKQIFSNIALNFAILSTVIFIVDYYLQIRIIQANLLHNQPEGIPLITQYNPYGIFIALEEIGFILMSIGFLFVAQIFKDTNGYEKKLYWILTINFILTSLSVGGFSFLWGYDLMDQLEIILVMVNWFTLIVIGFLVGKIIKKG